MGTTDEASAAFAELIDAITDAARFVEEHPFYADAENRVGAYLFVLGGLLARVEEDVIFDPDLPWFRVLDTRIREGGDNPDQRYLFSNIRGGETYRIWGTLGQARRLDLQVYAGTPYIPGAGGRSAAFLTFEDITVGDDGSFEVIASPQRQDGNWIENPADATRIIVRQILSDWDNERPGDVHIDRVGHEGDLKPVPTTGDLAERLRSAAASFTAHVNWWPEHVERHYLSAPPNRLSMPFDPGSLGGVAGRFMSAGWFDLGPDEALVLRTWPASGNYQGIQLTDLWFSSLEYANRQTSLTADQSHPDPDGSFRYVLAGADPGVPNWLDTLGRHRGVILLRYDGVVPPTFDPAHAPQAEVVPLASVREHLPAETPTMTASDRRRTIAARRRHVQLRFGN